jgi:centrosomal CEP192-like protein/type IX secretion system substrate protein
MKQNLLFSTIIVVLMFAFIGASAQKSDGEIAADHPKYVVFGNLDSPLINHEGAALTDAIKTLYFDPIKSSPVGSDCIFADFNDAFFSQYDITKFEACIFPMGDKSLDYKTSGGVSVISKLMEIKQAGNCAIIIGRKLLSTGFSGSAQTKNFFTNIMGISDYQNVSLMNGNTYKLYTMKGVGDDPVGKGALKHCNGLYSENGNPGESWVFYKEMETFSMLKSPNKQPTEWMTWETDIQVIAGMEPTTEYMGCRSKDNFNMFVVWSMSFDNLNNSGSITRIQTQLWQTLIWFSDNRPHTDAYLKLGSGDVAFNGVDVGGSEEKYLTFSNAGVEDLVIDDIYIFEMEDASIFQIVDGWNTDGDEITLKPNESDSIKIRFSPDEEREFNDYLYISSNSEGGKEDEVSLYGKGGEVIPDGMFYVFENSTITSSGKGITELDTLVATIIPVGTDNVTIITCEIVDNPDGAFTFLAIEDSRTPKFIDVDKTETINILFSGHAVGKMYTAKLKVESTNHLDPNKVSYCTLQGSFVGAGPVFTTDIDSVFYNGTNPVGETKEKGVNIWNTGDAMFQVVAAEIIEDDDNVFAIKNLWDMPRDFNFNEDPYELFFQFTPKAEKLYTASFKMEVSPQINGESFIYIKLRGEGKKTGITDPEVTSSNGLVTLKVYPNPVTYDATIEHTLHSQSSKYMNMFIVDMLGNKVMDFGSKLLSPGTQTLNYNTSDLSSGNYTLIADIDGSIVRLSVVVVK